MCVSGVSTDTHHHTGAHHQTRGPEGRRLGADHILTHHSGQLDHTSGPNLRQGTAEQSVTQRHQASPPLLSWPPCSDPVTQHSPAPDNCYLGVFQFHCSELARQFKQGGKKTCAKEEVTLEGIFLTVKINKHVRVELCLGKPRSQRSSFRQPLSAWQQYYLRGPGPAGPWCSTAPGLHGCGLGRWAKVKELRDETLKWPPSAPPHIKVGLGPVLE